MRTTSKIVVNKIRAHIVTCLDDFDTQELGKQLQAVADGFHNWYGPYEQKRTPSRQAAFKEWVMCLPSELSVELFYADQRTHLDYWHEGIPAPKKELSDTEVCEKYCYLIYRELSKLCKEYGISL